MKDPDCSKPKKFDDDFHKAYDLALRIGKNRFGTPCTHDRVVNGYCVQCLRNVVDLSGKP